MAKKISGLKSFYINCSLKKPPRESHTQRFMDLSIDIMKSEGVEVENLQFADHDIPAGVQPDMTEDGENKDEWPAIYQKVKAADIFVIRTPLWLGKDHQWPPDSLSGFMG